MAKTVMVSIRCLSTKRFTSVPSASPCVTKSPCSKEKDRRWSASLNVQIEVLLLFLVFLKCLIAEPSRSSCSPFLLRFTLNEEDEDDEDDEEDDDEDDEEDDEEDDDDDDEEDDEEEGLRLLLLLLYSCTI